MIEDSPSRRSSNEPLIRHCPRLLQRHPSTSSHSRVNLTWKNKPKIIFVDFYHWCLDLTWWKLFIGFTVCFVLINWFFGFLFWLGGPGTLCGVLDPTKKHQFLDFFSFSTQTIFTIGYGHVYPATWYANVLVLVESWIGLFINAFLIVITHGKFSRPSRAKRMIIFSDKACIVHRSHESMIHTPTEADKDEESFAHDNNAILRKRRQEDYDSNKDEGGWYLVFRFVNVRKAQLCDTRFHLLMLQWVGHDNRLLSLPNEEREQIDVEAYIPHYFNTQYQQSGYSAMRPGLVTGLFVRDTLRPSPVDYNPEADIENYDDVVETAEDDVQLRRRGSIVPSMRQFTQNLFGTGELERPHIVPKTFELDYEINVQPGRAKNLAFSSPLLPLPWMCSHKIDKQSPLYPYLRRTLENLRHGNHMKEAVATTLSAHSIEIVAILDGCDEATSDNLQARFSYTPNEIYMNHDFMPVVSLERSRFVLDYARFHKISPVTDPVYSFITADRPRSPPPSPPHEAQNVENSRNGRKKSGDKRKRVSIILPTLNDVKE